MHPVVQDAVRVWHLDLFSILHLELVGVREALRQHAPNAVGVQLDRQPHLLAELAGLADQVGACVCNNAGHLHRVPSGTFSHHVSVERVQDALVRELQGIIQQDHVLGLHLLHRVAALFGRLEILRPLLGQAFEHVPTIAEVAHGVDVKGVLPLAHRVRLVLVHRALQPLVRLLRELPDGFGDLHYLLGLSQLSPLHTLDLTCIPVLLVVPALVVRHLVHDGLHISARRHVKISAPLPVHVLFALV
mmetsp:Transcript_45251/g.130668  ORF Transcript_45251/g.130668 Transcript_45251/m.130668 type:complete len:246 (-) Transcript_45251:2155-2892(-)